MLTAIEVKNAGVRDKSYTLKDESGLYLEITPKGSKRWRVRYWFQGREGRLSVGLYPAVSLKAARDRRDEIRYQIAQGIDPSEARKADKAKAQGTNTFRAVAEEWIREQSGIWKPSHAKRISHRFEKDVFPWLGDQPMDTIEPPELLKTIRRIQSRGAEDWARRTLQSCGQVFRFGVVTGRCQRDISADLKGALPPRKTKHHACVTDPRDAGRLLQAIWGYEGTFVVQTALKLAPYLFLRPGEIRHCEWSEIDLERREWRIPASKMKMEVMHLVPLAPQVVGLFEELRPLTGSGRYAFPNRRSKDRPMSENTLNAALRYLGIGRDEMCSHGFRGMASTMLNEAGWKSDVIEKQLAHCEQNTVRASYNHAQHLPERRQLMNWWADYLDSLRTGRDAVPIF